MIDYTKIEILKIINKNQILLNKKKSLPLTKMEKKESLLPKSNTNNTAFEKKASLQPDLCFMDIYRSFDEKTT